MVPKAGSANIEIDHDYEEEGGHKSRPYNPPRTPS